MPPLMMRVTPLAELPFKTLLLVLTPLLGVKVAVTPAAMLKIPSRMASPRS